MTVEELIEWVANLELQGFYDQMGLPILYRVGREGATLILSHPDLALIDRTVDVGVYPFRDAVIPLAEAIKEMKP